MIAPSVKRPVAFRVPRLDTKTGGATISKTEWRLFSIENAAREAAEAIGCDYQELYVRDGSPNVELAAGLFYKTRGDKHNLPQIIGPLERTEDDAWPWLAIVCGQPWLWSPTGRAASIPGGERGPHNRDLVENVTIAISPSTHQREGGE